MTPKPARPVKACEWLPELKRLRELVEESGLDRQDVARLAGFASPGELSRALSGRRPNLRFPTIRRILLATGSTWADLDPKADR